MNRTAHHMTRPMIFACGVLMLAGVMPLVSCKDPTIGSGFNIGSTPDSSAILSLNEDCPAGDDWFPMGGGPPPPVRQFTPPPHPDTECPFYRGAYQNFLIATAPLGKSAMPGQQSATDPMLVNYATIDDAFTFTKPHLTRNTGTSYPYGKAGHDAVVGLPATGRAWLGAVRQAGQRNVLIDQDDHTLYYGLHMNQAFVDFIKQNNLDSPDGIKNVNPYLAFPPGLVEFKTAWKDIDPQDFPNGNVPLPPLPKDLSDNGGTQLNWDDHYITTMAWIPYLTQDANGVMHEDADHPVLRRMALVAVHSVYTLPGHPEFIWGSIQHVNVNAIDPGPVAYAGVSVLGAPDSQPNNSGVNGKASLPDPTDQTNKNQPGVASMYDYLLYKGGTMLSAADQPLSASNLHFVETSQSFPGQGALESVYRMFPGSKSDDLAPDGAVFSLNSNLNYAFAQAIQQGAIDPKIDKRQNYRLVAAVWLDKPNFFSLAYPGPAPGIGPDGTAALITPTGEIFQNDETNPMLIDASLKNPTFYPNVSQGITCGTPLDSTNTSGDEPNATGANNAVPSCLTRKDDVGNGDNPLDKYNGKTPGSTAIGVPKVGTDYEFSLLGGEDRLSSTSMETFTQNNNFRNCFTCHNTKPVGINGVPALPTDDASTVLLAKPALINVSHLFSEFLLQNQEEMTAASGQ